MMFRLAAHTQAQNPKIVMGNFACIYFRCESRGIPQPSSMHWIFPQRFEVDIYIETKKNNYNLKFCIMKKIPAKSSELCGLKKINRIVRSVLFLLWNLWNFRSDRRIVNFLKVWGLRNPIKIQLSQTSCWHFACFSYQDRLNTNPLPQNENLINDPWNSDLC